MTGQEFNLAYSIALERADATLLQEIAEIPAELRTDAYSLDSSARGLSGVKVKACEATVARRSAI